jgi:murein DD-endopeptidase MepM/ murein hydrolase activator NlpD
MASVEGAIRRGFSPEMWRRHSGTAGRGLVLFAVALLYAATPAGCAAESTVRILSHYDSMTGVTGGKRPSRHTGIDFDASRGDPVIAGADGMVVAVLHADRWCGNGVIVQHGVDETPLGWTRYCHMEETSAQPGQQARRGDVLGKVGTTGNSMGIPHLHFELCPSQPCRGYLRDTVDPLPLIAGCFDPTETAAYSALEASGKPRLVLTYPVRCAGRK